MQVGGAALTWLKSAPVQRRPLGSDFNAML
jgi:hypothetical protein